MRSTEQIITDWEKERANYYEILKLEKQAEIEDKRKKERADRIFDICCGINAFNHCAFPYLFWVITMSSRESVQAWVDANGITREKLLHRQIGEIYEEYYKWERQNVQSYRVCPNFKEDIEDIFGLKHRNVAIEVYDRPRYEFCEPEEGDIL